MAVKPVILVHGIQGSWLKDQYPIDYDREVLWTGILKKDFDSLYLHPMDAAVDADVRRLVMPHQAVPLVYEDLVGEIRNEMDRQPYAYMFTYDWRKDNRLAAKDLAVFIDRVLRIAGVHERAAGRQPPRQVVLIGHSMGGLVIKWGATQLLPARRIAKIITVATPWRGSLKAIEALLPGARNLFGHENQKSMRHAARTLPGLYQLLPSWEGAVIDKHTGKPLDPFAAATWQKSLLDKLAAVYGPQFFPQKLADAREFIAVVSRPWPAVLARKVYCVYGVGSATWKQVPVDTAKGNFFHFDEAVEDDQGDGTVHVLSGAQPPISAARTFIDHRHPVKDLVVGQHGNMPNHGAVQDWILGVLRINPYAAHSFRSPA